MIREAMRAGLNFDPEKLVEMGVVGSLEDAYRFERENERSIANGNGAGNEKGASGRPDIRIDVSSPSPPHDATPKADVKVNRVEWGHFNGANEEKNVNDECHDMSPFHRMLYRAHLARIHDSLEFSSGLGRGPVLSWKMMEYLPFRRMDLQSDGSWRPIRWPLPCGEVRDIPHTARVHGSVIRRMQHDDSYRPGNLIVGGGGRGMRIAPREYGIGTWECVQDPGDPIGEIWVKKTSSPLES